MNKSQIHIPPTNGSRRYPPITPITLTHTNTVISMGKSRRGHRHRSPSPSSSSSSESESSRSRSRSRSRSSRQRKHKRSRNSHSHSRSPPRSHHKNKQARTPTKKPYNAPTEPGRCANCDGMCKFSVTSDRNKEHPGWPYWKCLKYPGKESFNGWIHEGPLPANAPKGISFLSNTPSTMPLTLSNLSSQKPPSQLTPHKPKELLPPTQSLWTLSKPKLPKPSKPTTLPPLQPQQPLLPPTPQQPHPTPLKTKMPQTKPPTKHPAKKEKVKKPCYHYNPHLNVDNKINALTFNLSLYNSLARRNKQPISKIERVLFKIRQKFQTKNNIRHTPSPHKTHSIIYCIYNNKKHLSKLYVGQTIHTAYVRLQQHIHSYNNTPLHKYMQDNNPKSFRIFVLQHKKTNLDKAEQYWIAKLQTQINNNNPENLNHIPNLTSSRKFKKQISKNLYLNLTTERIFASRNYARRISFLNKITNKTEYLDTLHPKVLRKMLSTLANKTILPVIPRRLTKPTIFLQHTLPPSLTITKQHKYIINSFSKQEIKNLTLLITSTLHKKLSLIINKQKIKIPIPTTYISPILNRKILKQIFYKAQTFLPNNIKNKIDTAIVYKNLDTIGTLFFNYKSTAMSIPNNTEKTPTCSCHNPLFKTFLNKHGHIDTNDTQILTILEKYLHCKPTNITELANKGANYIIQPYITPKLLSKYFNKDITKFIQKITKQYNLPSYIFDDWQKYLQWQFAQITKNIPTSTPNYEFNNIKNSLKQIHQSITITPTDKMKNNLRFTCSIYTQRIIAHKITKDNILLENPNILENAKIEVQQSNQAYKPISKTIKQIITEHNQFLSQYQLTTTYNKLPFLYIIYKAHKHGNRAVTAAFNVTTTLLAKTLHTALRHIIKELQKNDNYLHQIHQTNRHWRIDNATDINYLLHHFNTSKLTPTTVQSFDIEGFYDNIDIPEMEEILYKLIPQAFEIANTPFLAINPKANTAYWTKTKLPDKYKHNNTYTFSAQNLIDLQTWHLKNAHIHYNNKIWRQTKGIGQGTNQSPDLADLILMYYEYEFIDYHTKNNKKIAQAFQYTTRKMDDILFINNPTAQQHIYKNETNPHGIYPQKFFTLTTDSLPTQTVNYLDMNIHISNTPKNLLKQTKLNTYSLQQLRSLAKKHGVSSRDNKQILIDKLQIQFNIKKKNSLYTEKDTIWNTKTYNKTENFPIKAINFPHYTSHTPQTILIGSIIGRLHSYTITNAYRLKDFLITAKKLFQKLITQNGYPTTLIQLAIKRFTHRHRTNYPVSQQELNKLLCQCMGNTI